MRLTAVLAIACLLALAFAGCSGKDKDGGAASSSSSSSSRSSHSGTSSSASHSATGTSTGSSSSTSTGSTGSNSPPTGTISATTNGTSATFSLNGTDADGDALSWTLAFGDGNSTNGTTLPATVPHNFTAGGNYTANYTLTDGKDSVAYNVTITVAAGGGGTFFTFAGAVKANCASLCESCDPAGTVCAPVATGAFGCASFNAGSTPAGASAQGGDCIWTALPAGAAGRPFTAVSSGGDPDLDFIDVCNVVDGSSTKSSWNSGPEAGTVPEGFPCVVLWEFKPTTAAAPSTITFTIG